jgi:alkylation response protein AidB-like acyl-CoA dehydrogenase
LIRRTVNEIERAGKERLEPVPQALIELARRDRFFATRLALRATERLFRTAGSSALFEGNELQRCFRDVHAVASRVTRLGMISAATGSTET